MFEEYREMLQTVLIPRQEFHPFPRADERCMWKRLSVRQRELAADAAKQWSGYGWPMPTASDYMEFVRNGNRSRFEGKLFEERRLPLLALALGECVQGKGKYLDDIRNGIWSMLEESTWVLPAHNMSFENGKVTEGRENLPYTTDDSIVYIDLFSAEAGALLAAVWYLLGNAVNAETPEVGRRVHYELERRIFRPFLEHDEFWWMRNGGKKVNNWNPWILSNIMTAAALQCEDGEERRKIIDKALECLEEFVSVYGADGGCDEGPSYWGVAGASLFDCIDVLRDVTGGAADLFGDIRIRNICAYIYKVQICGDNFINFADAGPKVKPNPHLLYRMGRLTGDEALTQMGVTAAAQNGSDVKLSGSVRIYRLIKSLECTDKMTRTKAEGYPYKKNVWLSDIQVMAAREKCGSAEGLYLAVKGGNNNESHNHNDIGNFLLYCNGEPVIVDLGSGVYERRTFSSERYEIPQNRSDYHNVPLIGGTVQPSGGEFRAEDVEFEKGCVRTSLSMELRGAYPKETGVVSWRRTCALERDPGMVTVRDTFSLDRAQEVSLVFVCAQSPSVKKGYARLASAGGPVRMEFPEGWTCRVESFSTAKDAKLSAAWGKAVYRLILTSEGPVSDGDCTVRFTEERKRG